MGKCISRPDVRVFAALSTKRNGTAATIFNNKETTCFLVIATNQLKKSLAVIESINAFELFPVDKPTSMYMLLVNVCKAHMKIEIIQEYLRCSRILFSWAIGVRKCAYEDRRRH